MTSDELQCCFIHIPKTAGTSIGKLLLDDLTAYDNKCHLTLRSYLRHSNYYKFTFIRNPWSRMVSYYHEKQLHPAKGKRGCLYSIPFEEYIHILARTPGTEDQWEDIKKKDVNIWNQAQGYLTHWIPKDLISHLDFIGRVESIENDWKKISQHLNIKRPLIWARKSMASEGKSYSDYYSAETRDIIYDIYKEDITHFNYDF